MKPCLCPHWAVIASHHRGKEEEEGFVDGGAEGSKTSSHAASGTGGGDIPLSIARGPFLSWAGFTSTAFFFFFFCAKDWLRGEEEEEEEEEEMEEEEATGDDNKAWRAGGSSPVLGSRHRLPVRGLQPGGSSSSKAEAWRTLTSKLGDRPGVNASFNTDEISSAWLAGELEKIAKAT
jgi:hypothetical protein